MSGRGDGTELGVVHGPVRLNRGVPSSSHAHLEPQRTIPLQVNDEMPVFVVDPLDDLEWNAASVPRPEAPSGKHEAVGVEPRLRPDEPPVRQGKRSGAERDVDEGEEHGNGGQEGTARIPGLLHHGLPAPCRRGGRPRAEE